jgi:hypothetical protein
MKTKVQYSRDEYEIAREWWYSIEDQYEYR